MTDIEKAVAEALRLSEAAAEKLQATIRRNILTARAELIRSGVPAVLAESENPLVEDAVITYCLYKMDDESMTERQWSAFQYQQDNLRKSTIKEPGGNEE
ncbi:MAG: hypothetical protein NC123_15660 [Butyrivibrio sp.]|nr:hypothetical protein [Acetatifactor muris]MCM1560956.1 hypothetical protein [Butyrivibrio sp.]